MKRLINSLISTILFSSVILLAGSCSDDSYFDPLSVDPVRAGEILSKQPVPGLYEISKFIEEGDDETFEFKGYIFEIDAHGSFIAYTPGGLTFNGSFELTKDETVMAIAIDGNPALQELDADDWHLVRISNKMIKIEGEGPDVVVFTRI